MLNVLKLVRCFWKHPVERARNQAVSFYMQYERQNYEGYGIVDQWGSIIRYDDEIDRHLFHSLAQHLSAIPGIDQLRMVTHEEVLWRDFESKTRAIFSRIAFGYEHNNIPVHTITHHVASLSSRVMFTDYESYGPQILAALPKALVMDMLGEVATLTRAEFYTKEMAEQVLAA